VSEKRRSAQEIRASLWETRTRLDRDLEELDVRIHESLSPRALIARHPALIALAGAALGYLLIRKPALLARGIVRAAQVGAPFLAKSFLK
jgi:hypothetical protein